jgi:hypothetical protein
MPDIADMHHVKTFHLWGHRYDLFDASDDEAASPEYRVCVDGSVPIAGVDKLLEHMDSL